MRKLVKLLMAMGLLIGASPNLNAQDVVMSGIELSDAIAQCDAGDADLCQEVAMYYEFQTYQNPSFNYNAFDYFEKACELSLSNACLMGSYLTLDAEMAAFRGFQPDYDRGVRMLEKGCAINDSLSPAMCAELAIFYFEGRYDAMTLEQAYSYAKSECDDNHHESCFALYYAYDQISNIPGVPKKRTLFIKAIEAKIAFQASIPPPLEWMN